MHRPCELARRLARGRHRVWAILSLLAGSNRWDGPLKSGFDQYLGWFDLPYGDSPGSGQDGQRAEVGDIG